MIKDTQQSTALSTAQDLDGLQLLRATYTKQSFPRHFHDTYVIRVQERGVEEFHYRGASHRSPTGSLVVIHPGEVRTGRGISDEPWTYRAMYPSPDLVREIASQFGDRDRSLPYFPSPVVFDRQLARALFRLYRILEVSREPLERQTAFARTIALLIQKHSDRDYVKPLRPAKRAINLARDYIEDNYTENLSLTDLANTVGLNRFYLLRAFSKEVGLPPHEFLTQVRIDHAKKLLADGLPIADVALQVGFVDQSHLTNRFRRFVGLTPKEYAHPLSS